MNPNSGDVDKSQAVVTYLGVGRSSFPLKDPKAVESEFGLSRGADLKRYVEGLIAELFAIEIEWANQTLTSGTEIAMAHMRDLHPELGDDAIKALGWEFSYSWR